jgi:predicted ribosomally synthesized peptide with SipW-like signal peptide
MLLGTTYAWFTDSVTSANNIIKSGSLDIDIEYAKGENGALSKWNTVSGSSDIFSPNTFWEPGRTEVVYFKVANYGTLALRYKMTISILNETIGMNKDGGEICLSDKLVFKVVEMNDKLTVFSDRKAAIMAAESSQGIKDYGGTAHELLPGESDYLALIVHMPENLDNSFNYRGTMAPSIELGVNLLAIQLSSESDSFGSDYDAECDFPKSYGLLIDEDMDLYIDDHDLDLLSHKNLDSLIHVTNGAKVNIYANIKDQVYNGGYIETPAISADKNSVVNIYGGTYYARATPIITAVDGATFNIYHGIFGADSHSGDDEQTDQLLSCAPDCKINIYGGNFVNFDPSTARDGNMIVDGYKAIDTLRASGEI